MTKANEFDKINELLIERTAKKFERASKNKLKKFLTNENEYDIIKEEMKELFSLPLYDILDPKDAKQLFFQIIKYFKGEI